MQNPMKLLLLPGLDGTGELFARFRKLLPPTVVAEVCPLPTSGDQQPRSLATAIAESGVLRENTILLAESFSGPIAYHLVKDHGASIKGLILVSSFLSMRRPMLALARLLPLGIFPWHSAPAWALRMMCVGWDASDELVAEVRRAIQSVPVSLIAQRVRVLSELKLPSEPIRIPCMYLLPSNDKLVPRWHAAHWQRVCGDLTVREIPGPHFLLQANPEECVAAVRNFLERFGAP
jgi:pimeloyl-ACP methyl ester carboxylesterase